MKTIIPFLLLLTLLLSCKELLQETPKNFISPDGFYKSEADAEGAIAGVYSSVFPLNGDVKNFDEQHTDYVTGRGSFISISNFDKILSSDQNGRISNFWANYFNTVNRANIVLNRVPTITAISPATQTRILAEARFLRAWAYFNLAINYGAVPLRTTELTDLNTVATPRASLDKVYELILADLLIAEKDLPETVGSSTGKASKWAAKMLMARVYLTRENWALAAEKANDVISSGKYSLVPVGAPDDFYRIFATTTSTSEDIMSHHPSINRQSTFINWLHGAGTPYNKGTVFGFTLLPNMASPLIKEWADADLRKSFNLYSKYVNASGVTVTLPSTNPWLFKKLIKDPNGNALYMMPIFRYAEALLMYAEAATMVEGKPSALALERLNSVRRRGYGLNSGAASAVDYPAGLTKDQFRSTVLKERAYEFMLENIRWWDLKRTKTAKEAIEAAGKKFINERLLYPIPQAELNANSAITQQDQNPGY